MELFGVIYGASALVTTALVYFASKRFSDIQRPATVRFGLSLAAGVLWPLVILGLVEFGSFVAYTKVAEETAIDLDTRLAA